MKLDEIAIRGAESRVRGPLYGPHELAGRLVRYREAYVKSNRGNRSCLSPLSEENVRKLVDLAYYASQVPEEGRFVRFRLVNREQSEWFLVTKFDAPVRLEQGVESLRRLAPACAHPDCALLVVERDSQLCCDGIVNVSPMGQDARPGRPELTVGGGEPPSLHIGVHGPGRLLVQDAPLVFSLELRAGRIRQLAPFSAVPAVQMLQAELSASLFAKVVEKAGDRVKYAFGGQFAVGQLALAVLSAVLRTAFEKRHGGAFVLLPGESQDPRRFNVEPRYRAANLDLGSDVVEFWLTCAEAERAKKKEDFHEAASAWARRKAKLLTDAEALGNLSCVDGCVVLNRALQLCGFGAEIGVSEEEARKHPRPFKNAGSGKCYDYDDFIANIGGTRHRSAARLCKVHQGVIAFIVSQDGELKAFVSDEGGAYGFRDLDAHYLPGGL